MTTDNGFSRTVSKSVSNEIYENLDNLVASGAQVPDGFRSSFALHHSLAFSSADKPTFIARACRLSS
jgi:hypothetical protein